MLFFKMTLAFPKLNSKFLEKTVKIVSENM